MHVITRKTLKAFWLNHADAEQPLRTWYATASRANWSSPNDIKQDFPHASILANDRVVFNIKGNTYRLIVVALYKRGVMLVRFVGTHAEYDKIDATTI